MDLAFAPDTQPQDPLAPFRRSPDVVMRLARLGSLHRSRLSFLDTLLRDAAKGWRFGRTLWEFDHNGVGRAIYTVDTGGRRYSLVAFGHDLLDEERSDRVIATRWDATFALFDGDPTANDLERLADNVPKQEAGRVSGRELTLSRANKSVRLFTHVVDALARGTQPDDALIESTGYLMRTTAVYGSGKFGAADRAAFCDRAELAGPFRAEMLTVWLIRAFTIDWAEWLAKQKGGEQAARLAPKARQQLGVGNSTGLGMAPFLVRHPILLSNWIKAREEALARVRALRTADNTSRARVAEALRKAQLNAEAWQSDHLEQIAKLEELRRDLSRAEARLAGLPSAFPYDALLRDADDLSLEGQEALVSILIDAHPQLVDDLTQTMGADEDTTLDGAMTIGRLRAILLEHYASALALDYADSTNITRFWYTSEEKLEPRLGERFEEPGGDLEEPLAVGRDIAAMAADLSRWPDDVRVGAFLAHHPEHRHVARRAQLAPENPFAEIKDNLIGADMKPIGLLRCKLSFFGASRFDPRSDRWVRVNLFHGQPHPNDILSPLR